MYLVTTDLRRHLGLKSGLGKTLRSPGWGPRGQVNRLHPRIADINITYPRSYLIRRRLTPRNSRLPFTKDLVSGRDPTRDPPEDELGDVETSDPYGRPTDKP